MRPLSKTDLRRSRPALSPPQPVPRVSTGTDEEAMLFGETKPAIPAPPLPVPESEKDSR